MKKYISIILAAAVILTTAGCSENNTALNSGAPTVMSDDEAYSHYLSTEGESARPTGGSSSAAEPEGATGTDDSALTTTAGAPATTVAATAADRAEEVKPTAPVAPEWEAESPVMDSVKGDFDFGIGAPGIGTDDVMVDTVDGLAGVFEGEVMPEPVPPIEDMPPAVDPQAGLLTGGEWNDNENWNAWVSLYQTHDDWSIYRDIWQFEVDNRYEVTVTAGGKPVEGAKVSINGGFISEAVTDNNGKAYLFFSDWVEDMEYTLTVTDGSSEKAIPVTLEKSESFEIELDTVADTVPKSLDLMMMIDTTGSMTDELVYIQEELRDVITRVQSENGNIPIRVSVNFYRDEGDEYVIREFPFTTDINGALSDLAAQSAGGGGDFPEAVHTAMNSALNNHDWESSTKLMFFVLDAPPHEDIQIVGSVKSLTADFAAEGIRIIPVASSGIDKSTEHLLRTMAFATGGTYAFLTDDSGIGSGHIEPTIGDYDVEKLNDMMVRIIGEYLA